MSLGFCPQQLSPTVHKHHALSWAVFQNLAGCNFLKVCDDYTFAKFPGLKNGPPATLVGIPCEDLKR